MYAARVRRRPHYRMSMDFRLSDKVTGDPTRHVVIRPTPFITTASLVSDGTASRSSNLLILLCKPGSRRCIIWIEASMSSSSQLLIVLTIIRS